MDEPLLHRLAIALGVGLIVGVERGWRSRPEAGGQRPAGVRTFSLAGLLGGVLAALGGQQSHIVLAAGMLAIGAFAIVSYVLTVRETRDVGITTELSLVATFGLGALAVLGAPFEAAAAAIVMALVLGMKTEFHKAILGLERHELLATLQLLLIAVVLVPLLPARPMGPWDAVNPRTVGMLVLLIAGFSYLLRRPRIGFEARAHVDCAVRRIEWLCSPRRSAARQCCVPPRSSSRSRCSPERAPRSSRWANPLLAPRRIRTR